MSLDRTFCLRLSLRLSVSRNFWRFGSASLSKNCFTFWLSLVLDRTLAQLKAQQKGKPKREVTQCQVGTQPGGRCDMGPSGFMSS